MSKLIIKETILILHPFTISKRKGNSKTKDRKKKKILNLKLAGRFASSY